MTYLVDISGWGQPAYEAVDQWENWQNLLDISNAIRYGFSQYRLPKPGQPIDVREAEERIARIDKEWSGEHRTRGNKGERPCPNFLGLSIEGKTYLNSVLESKKGKEGGDIYFPQYG